MNADQEGAGSAALGIATLRVWCGAWFLLMAALKLPVWGADWDLPARFAKWLEMAAATGAHPQYRLVLKGLLANPQALLYGTAFVEAGLGMMFVLGLHTRVACAGAIFLYVNYWLATARLGFTALAPTLTIGVTAACLWIGDAGRHYGVDGVRARRKPTTLTPPIRS